MRLANKIDKGGQESDDTLRKTAEIDGRGVAKSVLVVLRSGQFLETLLAPVCFAVRIEVLFMEPDVVITLLSVFGLSLGCREIHKRHECVTKLLGWVFWKRLAAKVAEGCVRP